MHENDKPRGRRSGDSGDLTKADVVVLSLLEEHPMHGYDLVAEYDRQEIADWASVSKAQVYYALRKLEQRGLVTGRLEDGLSREKVVFSPTEKGRMQLKAALGDSAWATTRLAQPFTTWVGLSIHLDTPERDRLVEARRAFLKAELLRESASLAFIGTLAGERAKRGAAIVSLVIRQIETELLWIEEVLAPAP